MGKAYKAPATTYARHVRISRKATLAFREITGAAWIDRPDSDLANHLDELINAAPPYLVVADVNHADVLTYVHAIEVGDETRYAIVRDGCCVTLLVAAMIERNLRGTWARASEDAGAPVFAPAMCGAHHQTVPCGGCARETEAYAGGRPAPLPLRDPFPIVIEHKGSMADMVVPMSDGIELRVDDENRLKWQLETSRAIELRDALSARLPPQLQLVPEAPRYVPANVAHSPSREPLTELQLAGVALVDARRQVVLTRRAFALAQEHLINAQKDECVAELAVNALLEVVS